MFVTGVARGVARNGDCPRIRWLARLVISPHGAAVLTVRAREGENHHGDDQFWYTGDVGLPMRTALLVRLPVRRVV